MTIKTRVEKMKIEDLKLLDVNARFMRHETFQQLVDNIRRDGALTSAPLVWKDKDGEYIVLSGNHRVMAAKEAGLKDIYVIATDDPLTKDQRIAIQLSHNSIVGEDDPEVLRQLYESIEDLDLKEYSGLDDKTLDLLESVSITDLHEAVLDYQSIVLLFLPDEKEELDKAFKEAMSLVSGDEFWAARWKDYDDYMEAVATTTKAYDIKNVATALNIILKVFKTHLQDLQQGWIHNTDDNRRTHWIPLSTILGVEDVAPTAAQTINRAVEKMISRGEVSKDEAWKALEIWAKDYLRRG